MSIESALLISLPISILIMVVIKVLGLDFWNE